MKKIYKKLRKFLKSKIGIFTIILVALSTLISIPFIRTINFLGKTQNATITEFSIPTASSSPRGITKALDGTIWFTESASSKIGKLDTNNSFTEYALPSPDSLPEDITTGPDGNLWFTETNANKIGKITPDGQITEYDLPESNSNPFHIIQGPDGNLWFTEQNTPGKIGKITTDGQITEFPAENFPGPITLGPDNNIWFSNGYSIFQITPSGTITAFPVPSSTGNIFSLTTGIDGNLWFTDGSVGTSKISKMTTNGTITEYPINGRPFQIISDSYGTLWFTQLDPFSNIGSLMQNGTFSEVPLPTNCGTSGCFPYNLVQSDNNTIWFTEANNNKIAKLAINDIPPTPQSTPTPQPSSIPTPTLTTNSNVCIQSLQASAIETTMSKPYSLTATLHNSANTPQQVTITVNESGSNVEYADNNPSPISTTATIDPSSTQTVTIGTINHVWNWLDPQNNYKAMDEFINNTSNIYGNIGLVNSITLGLQNTLSNTGIFDVDTVLDMIANLVQLNLALSKNTYTYSTTPELPICQSGSSSTEVTVNVPYEKKLMLAGAFTADFASNQATAVGIPALISGQPWSVIALGTEYGYKFWGADLLWSAAKDPDSNYTQIVQPSPKTIPNTQSLTGNDAIAITHLGNSFGFTDAALKSLAKADGAAQAGDSNWELTQLQKARDYFNQSLYESKIFLDKSDGLKSAQDLYNSTPNAQTVVSNYLQQNGLPPIESQSLSQLGYTQQQINISLEIIKDMLPSLNPQNFLPTISSNLLSPAKSLLNDTQNQITAINGTNPQDVVNPTSSIISSGTLGSNNWYRSNVSITLNATDNPQGSGIQKIEYSLDGGINWLTYSSPFTISTEGTTIIQSRAIDNTGNIEFPPQFKEIKIDKTAPELSFIFNSQTKNIEGSGIDLISGVDTTSQTSTTLTVKDKAGNISQFLYSTKNTKLTRTIYNQTLTITSLKYNNINQNIPKTYLSVSWSQNNSGVITYLLQSHVITNQQSIVALYDASKSKTTNFTVTTGSQITKSTLQGLVLIKLTTKSGTLKLSY